MTRRLMIDLDLGPVSFESLSAPVEDAFERAATLAETDAGERASSDGVELLLFYRRRAVDSEALQHALSVRSIGAKASADISAIHLIGCGDRKRDFLPDLPLLEDMVKTVGQKIGEDVTVGIVLADHDLNSEGAAPDVTVRGLGDPSVLDELMGQLVDQLDGLADTVDLDGQGFDEAAFEAFSQELMPPSERGRPGE